MERETGIEPARTSLGSWRHTDRRLAHFIYYYNLKKRSCQAKNKEKKRKMNKIVCYSVFA